MLDVGAGSGRVALDLAARGHRVTALDRDAELLRALRERAGEACDRDGLRRCAHARSPAPRLRVCLVPMQTIQLLRPAPDALAFLRQARAHLRRAACSRARSSPMSSRSTAPRQISGRTPETRSWTGSATSPTDTRACGRRDRAHRARAHCRPTGAQRHAAACASTTWCELDRVSATQLLREGARSGSDARGQRSIPATGRARRQARW